MILPPNILENLYRLEGALIVPIVTVAHISLENGLAVTQRILLV